MTNHLLQLHQRKETSEVLSNADSIYLIKERLVGPLFYSGDKIGGELFPKFILMTEVVGRIFPSIYIVSSSNYYINPTVGIFWYGRDITLHIVKLCRSAIELPAKRYW